MQTRTRRAALAGLLLHTIAVLWLWARWDPGLRGAWMIWVDLPLSLLWVGLSGGALLAVSLVVGGLWWGALSAGLTLAIGRLTASRR